VRQSQRIDDLNGPGKQHRMPLQTSRITLYREFREYNNH
jgi:hypothetical protein